MFGQEWWFTWDGKSLCVQGKDDYEIAAAQIGVEVYSAMNAALGQ